MTGTEGTRPTVRTEPTENTEPTQPTQPTEPAEPTDPLDPLPGSWTALARTLRMGWRADPRMILVAFLTTLAGAVPDALFAYGLAAFAGAVIGGDSGALAASAALLAAMAAGTWLLQTVGTRVNQQFAERTSVLIEAHIAALQAGIPTIEHHERPDRLDRLSVLREHASALSSLYYQLFTIIGALVRLAITLGLLMSVDPVLALLGLAALPAVWVSGRRGDAEKRAEEAGARHHRLARQLFLLTTSAAGGKELRVAGSAERLRELRHLAWRRHYRPQARARWISAGWHGAAQAVFGLAFTAAAAHTATQGPGRERAAALLLVLTAGSRLSGYLGQTLGQIHTFRAIWLDCARKLAWLEDYADAARSRAALPAPHRLREGIRLDGVDFRYPGTRRPVLEGVDLLLPAGAVVAVVGENGAGKSTLVKLLCGLYAPTGGRILLDGQDLAATDPADWRLRTTGAFQDFFPWELRLRRSVGIGDLPRGTDGSAVRAALDRAGASAFADTLPQGIDTQLGASRPSGVDLSHGQWQRVALARGLMRRRPLLTVLDEPTSAVDAETEHALFERYAHLSRARAEAGDGGITVLVSHRFSTVRSADLIVVLDGTRIAEHGTHGELMRRGGTYAQLYGIQEASYR